MWRSMIAPEMIFRRSIRLLQTDRMRWTIQTYSDQLNWARRRTFHGLNSLFLIQRWVLHMKRLTFGLGSRQHIIWTIPKINVHIWPVSCGSFKNVLPPINSISKSIKLLNEIFYRFPKRKSYLRATPYI